MQQKKKPTGLGKGLDALLPTINYTGQGFTIESDEHQESSTYEIEISKIVFNPYQPRKDFDVAALDDLKRSIIEHGIIQPITVRNAVSGYELISGERRMRAAIAAGFLKIPAYVLENVTDLQMLEMALIENVQRENLNPIETANGYQRLIEECNLTQEEVSKKIGKDRSTITNFLRLLKLPDKIQESLRKRELTMGHARTLLAVSDTSNMLPAWHRIIEEGLSVRATESLVKDIESGRVEFSRSGKLIETKEKVKKKDLKDTLSAETKAQLEDDESRLRHIYSTQVRVIPKSEYSGVIEFDFYTIDEYERIMDLFNSVKSSK